MSAPIFCTICGEAFGLTVQQSDTPNVCDECECATDDGDEQPAESNEDPPESWEDARHRTRGAWGND